MRMKHLAGVLVVGLVVGVSGSVAGQELSPAALTRIKGGFDKIEKGQAREGRQALVAEFDQAAPELKTAVAKKVAEQAEPLLKKLDGPRAFQLALAVAAIHDAATQPALEVMVSHKDEAVRLLGWRGYVWTDPEGQRDGVREQLIAAKSTGASAMWASLASRFEKETSSVIYGTMFEMMRIPPLARHGMGAAAADAVDAANLALLEKSLNDVCMKIVDGGDEEMTRSARGALMAMEYFHRNGQAETKNKVVRYVVEILYCAAKSYELEAAEGDLAEAAKQLVVDADLLLRRLTEKRLSESLDKALKSEDPGSAVVLVAYDWCEMLSVDKADVTKKYQAKYRTKATTQPAKIAAPPAKGAAK
ncbi:MAG: hypothetical protein FWE88_07180 [Phycisphaerae bacterium]|nr:hypothetical protein [Phycisphaerae bacterium]